MKKQKGFTLIELLVVVAIIGILAAIGVVTFGGFQGAAKRNAVTSNHNNLKKFMAAQMAKCPLGETITLKDSAAGGTTTVSCPVSASGSVAKFIKHFEFEGWKNPYDTSTEAVKSSCGSTDGCTQLTATSTSVFSVTSYYKNKDGTSGTTIGPDTITVE